MRSRVLVALGVLGLAASAVTAAERPAATGRDEPGAAALAEIGVVPENEEARVPPRLHGTVVAADPELGRLLLVTDAGMIGLRADPEDIAQLSVGDEIEVVMLDEFPDTMRASEPGS